MKVNERGIPVTITSQRHDGMNGIEDNQPLCRVAVESIGEVWLVDDEWWREPIRRRYVEVMLEGGKHVVLYETLPTGEWYVQTA